MSANELSEHFDNLAGKKSAKPIDKDAPMQKLRGYVEYAPKIPVGDRANILALIDSADMRQAVELHEARTLPRTGATKLEVLQRYDEGFADGGASAKYDARTHIAVAAVVAFIAGFGAGVLFMLF